MIINHINHGGAIIARMSKIQNLDSFQIVLCQCDCFYFSFIGVIHNLNPLNIFFQKGEGV